MKLKEIRKEQYEYHNYYKGYGYNWLKARFYMETSALLVYYLQDKKIHPNVLTILYSVLGIIGGVLLASHQKLFVSIALFIFFFKGILDWSDGHLARIQNKTSLLGKHLDKWGGIIGTASFYLGLSFYLTRLYNLYTVLWALIVFSIIKLIDVKIGRAWTIDTILFLVGIQIFLLDK